MKKKTQVKKKVKQRKLSYYQRKKAKAMREYNKQCEQVAKAYAESWNTKGGDWKDAP